MLGWPQLLIQKSLAVKQSHASSRLEISPFRTINPNWAKFGQEAHISYQGFFFPPANSGAVSSTSLPAASDVPLSPVFACGELLNGALPYPC